MSPTPAGARRPESEMVKFSSTTLGLERPRLRLTSTLGTSNSATVRRAKDVMTNIIDQLVSRTWTRLLGWTKRRTKEGLLLGFLIQDGKVTRHKLYLPHEKRTHHLELLGKTGMGKSSQVCSFIKQDIEQNRG